METISFYYNQVLIINLYLKNKYNKHSVNCKNRMIFSLPRSNSSMEYHFYRKPKLINQNKSELSNRHSNLLARSNGNVGSSIKKNFYQSQILSTRYMQSPKKQLLYNKKRSQSSCDRYLIENKKRVQSQIIERNMNQYEKKIYRDSQENRRIYLGKKLVDPIHQKFNYFIKHETQSKPLVINDFLLEPCKINPKKLQTRTSQSFTHTNIQTDQREDPNPTTRNRTHSLRTYHNPRHNFSKNEASPKIKQKNIELSTQYYVMGSKFQSKHYCVDPWEFDPLSQNMDSIKIH